MKHWFYILTHLIWDLLIVLLNKQINLTLFLCLLSEEDALSYPTCLPQASVAALSLSLSICLRLSLSVSLPSSPALFSKVIFNVSTDCYWINCCVRWCVFSLCHPDEHWLCTLMWHFFHIVFVLVHSLWICVCDFVDHRRHANLCQSISVCVWEEGRCLSVFLEQGKPFCY